jgi:hypothetical protein
MLKVPVGSPIEFLVRRRYPAKPSAMTLRYGSQEPALSTHFPTKQDDDIPRNALLAPDQSKLLALRDAYRRELMAKQPAEIEQLVASARQEDEESLFFNQESSPDYGHWCNCAFWTLDEAVSLSFGKEPSVVRKARMEPFKKQTRFGRDYFKRWDLVTRAKEWGQLFDPVAPGIFIPWAKNRDIDLPEPLLTRASLAGIRQKDWQNMYEDAIGDRDEFKKEIHKKYCENLSKRKDALEQCRSDKSALAEQLKKISTELEETKVAPLGMRERDSLRAMALVAAMSAYGFHPGKKNTASKAISSDLYRLGLSLSEDTVRTHLKSAAEDLPPNWQEKFKPNSGSR